uniref:Uncharacterized protein n=1 Tax=Acrobeloides nanus TaxID=290746 RepID=A0A914EHU9_9BILA
MKNKLILARRLRSAAGATAPNRHSESPLGATARIRPLNPTFGFFVASSRSPSPPSESHLRATAPNHHSEPLLGITARIRLSDPTLGFFVASSRSSAPPLRASSRNRRSGPSLEVTLGEFENTVCARPPIL